MSVGKRHNFCNPGQLENPTTDIWSAKSVWAANPASSSETLQNPIQDSRYKSFGFTLYCNEGSDYLLPPTQGTDALAFIELSRTWSTIMIGTQYLPFWIHIPFWFRFFPTSSNSTDLQYFSTRTHHYSSLTLRLSHSVLIFYQTRVPSFSCEWLG